MGCKNCKSHKTENKIDETVLVNERKLFFALICILLLAGYGFFSILFKIIDLFL